MAKIGFIGLGIMGLPMAGNLQKAGYQLYLNDRAQIPQSLVEGGAMSCASGREVAENSDIIIRWCGGRPFGRQDCR